MKKNLATIMIDDKTESTSINKTNTNINKFRCFTLFDTFITWVYWARNHKMKLMMLLWLSNFI